MGCEMGVLGVGHLASALLEGVFKHGVLSPEQVLLSDHVPAQLDRFAAMGCTIASSNAELKTAPRLLLAVRPQSFDEAAAGIGDLSSEQLVISVMAGLDSSTIQQALGGACRVVRAMPNTGATFGASMTCLATGAGGNEEDLQQCLGIAGPQVDADKSKLDPDSFFEMIQRVVKKFPNIKYSGVPGG